MLQSYILQFRKQLVKKIRRDYFDKLKRLLLLLLPLVLLCACTTAPAEQADAPFSFYYRCAEVAFGGEDGVIRAEAAPLEADADLRTVVLQYLKGPASPELRTPLPADWALESIGLTEGTAELVFSGHAVPEPRPHHPQRLPCPDAPAAARCAAREHSAQRRRRGRCAGRQGYPAARQRHGGAGGRARALCAGRGAALSRARNADRRRHECGRPARRDRAPPAGPAGKRERHSRGHGTAQRQCRKRRLHRRSLLAVPDGDAAQLEHGAAGRLRHCEFSDGAAADSDRGSLDRGRTLGAAVCTGSWRTALHATNA